MRVIAGTARSLPLAAPEGLDTRPTTDKIKETLFNMLQMDVPGSVFLDLFSGSGSIGVEALSRGAKKAYFVETNAKAVSFIEKNLDFTKLREKAVVLKQDVCSALGVLREERVDIIYMDPPYDCGHEKAVFACLQNAGWVKEDTIIVAEASLQTDFSWLPQLGFQIAERRGKLLEKRYKTNKHVFIKRISL